MHNCITTIEPKDKANSVSNIVILMGITTKNVFNAGTKSTIFKSIKPMRNAPHKYKLSKSLFVNTTAFLDLQLKP